MNRIENLRKPPSNLFNDGKELISLENDAFPSFIISSSTSYEDTSTNPN